MGYDFLLVRKYLFCNLPPERLCLLHKMQMMKNAVIDFYQTKEETGNDHISED